MPRLETFACVTQWPHLYPTIPVTWSSGEALPCVTAGMTQPRTASLIGRCAQLSVRTVGAIYQIVSAAMVPVLSGGICVTHIDKQPWWGVLPAITPNAMNDYFVGVGPRVAADVAALGGDREVPVRPHGWAPALLL